MKVRHALVVWALILAFPCGFLRAETVRLADGTPVHVRLTADLLSGQAAEGARVDLEVSRAVTQHGAVVIPEGSVVWGAIQIAKLGKTLHFDIEGVRLPNLKTVKLRSSSVKSKSVGKDEVKVESHVGGDLGAPKGSEFTAYLDEDVTLEVAGAPAAEAEPTLPVAVAPAAPAEPTPPPISKPVAPSRVVAKQSSAKKHGVLHRAGAPAAAAVSPAAAPQPPAQSVTPPAPVAPAPPVAAPPPMEYITVECFSDPLGADILIDDEFHGNTPSILKIPSGNHQLEFRLFGYKGHAESLPLAPGTGIRTIRVTLEKQP